MPVLILLLLAFGACRFDPGSVRDDATRGDGRAIDTQGSASDAPTDMTVAADASARILIEAESPTLNVSDGSRSWVVETALAGFTGTGYMSALPSNLSACALIDLTCGAVATYSINIAIPGTYAVTLRHYSPGGCCDSVFWTLGFAVAIHDFTPDTATMWTDDTSPTTAFLTAGPQTFTMRIREPGAHVDSIRLDLL